MPTVLDVLFPLPLPAFSYLLPFEQEVPAVGCRVVVPWQAGVRIGLVMACREVAASKALELREIIASLDKTPFFSADRLDFLGLVAEKSCAPLGQVLATLSATGFTEAMHHEVRLLEGVKNIALASEHWTDAAALSAAKLDLLRRQGLIQERVSLQEPLTRVLRPVKLLDEGLKGKAQAKQRQALEWLWELGSVASAAELARAADVSESSVRSLVKKGYLEYAEEPRAAPPLPSYPALDLPPVAIQATASIAAISGGTRVQRLASLLTILKADLAAGKSVLVLVPEHNLLVETAAYLSSCLPTQVMSGDLNDGQRQRLWQELPELEPLVLVGTYLAILVPLRQLVRVIVLEEGSSSYKLQSGPRFYIPKLAALLAQCLKLPFLVSDSILTPETLQRVPAEARLQLAYPDQRWHFTDLNSGANWPLSAELIRVLKQVRERERQAILIAPRRGFSAALGCAECNYLAMCPNCDLSLRYHQQQHELRCHQCGHRAAPPELCPKCQGDKVGPRRGAGTQWIATEVSKHLGAFPVYRFDADKREDLRPLLEGEAGVVVATTAILRHPKLPNLSLVALTLFDSLLSAGDFRAEEEALRLLFQLAELSGKRRPLLLLQTFQPEHSILTILRDLDPAASLESFFERLLERRRAYHYPPFVAVAKVQVSTRDAVSALHEANWLADVLRLIKGSDVLGPTPAPVARLKKFYTYQLFIRDLEGVGFQTLLQPALAYQGKARVRIDIDPRDIAEFLD